MAEDKEIGSLNNKLVELYGKLIKIKYKLDTLDNKNVKAQPIDKLDSGEGTKQRQVQASQRPDE